MAYSPTFTDRFAAKLIEPIAENLCLLVEARQTYAISLVKGSLEMPDFYAVYRSSPGVVVTEFPILMLDSCRSAAPTAEDGSHIEEAHEFSFELAVAGDDPQDLTTKMYRYVAAVDKIWRSATRTELRDGITPETSAWGAEILSITHEYGPLRGDTQYLRVVGINLTMAVMEL